MRYKKVKLSVVFLLGLELTGLQAQEAISTSGGNASGAGGTASYSVGQIVYSTFTGTNGSLTQGVQQPYEISVVTGLKEAIGIDLVCSVYPNPATDFVTLKAGNYETEDLTYQLYNSSGNLLEKKKIEGYESIIVISKLVPGTYFLKVNAKNKEIKTFKIIKH